MKYRSILLYSVLILVAGIILIIIHNYDVFSALIITLGVVFIIPGVINLMVLPGSNNPKKNDTKRRSRQDIINGLISSTGSVILGITMIGWSNLYVKFLPIIFAILLIIGGCFHFCAIAMAFRPTKLPTWLYLFPSLLVIIGLVVIYMDKAVLLPHHIVLLTGIGFVVFAINTMFELWFSRKITAPTKQQQESPDVIDIDAQ